ncbi:glycosyltransferase family 4 protein [Campylobacter hyointestinalis]|uniref:glycosyltransferase family 4 protein n=1 Tax=Campylobacter hyointestinalis TaxID=198 RepID=UPI001BD4F312|nr:glycosyltransferase family 4 protein [Campylobacter hyointestinalis]MBT0612541.1 glycosyltransferase family 4 protein [Campylobacter hyointestinalis subsp. hyointestinalis]MDY2999424.1 glycosyltransferase family 4 protein [Campylobacter hyointestinalis]
MKIVQILPELNEGGVERGVIDINRALAQNNFKSFVISRGGKLANHISRDGGKHIKFNVFSKNIFSFIFRVFGLRKILKDINPDIIHVRSRVPAWLVFFANKTLKLKVVSTVHGLNSPNFYSKIMTKADAIIVPSNCVKEHILKYFKADIKKITIIARGVDLKTFNPSNLDKNFIEEFKAKFGIQNGDFIVTSVGRITELKDYETFIKAISLLAKTQKVKALIVGSSHQKKQQYFKSLQDLVVNLGLKNSVIFTGNQSKIAEIYALSDVVVSSSKKPESFGRSVAEALALNTPVVASNHGGVKDIIIKGQNGFFFEIGDFNGLSNMILQARELKFDGFEYIKNNFSFEQMFDKTIKIYEETAK